jgi:Uma2 family endonuclease
MASFEVEKQEPSDMTTHHRSPLEQIRDLLPDDVRAEIIAGELIVYPPPTARHNRVSYHLMRELDDALGDGKGSTRRRWLFLEGAGVYFPDHMSDPDAAEREYVIPDVAGWRIGNAPTDLDMGIFEERPDWVCEVLSSKPKRDRESKREIYQRMGIAHYWMVHPRERWIDACSLPSTQLYQCQRHAYAPTLQLEPFDLELDLRRIFDVEL